MIRMFPIVIATILVSSSAAYAGDGFEAVKCGSDIPSALVGKRLSVEPFAAVEGRHRDLSLKSLGGDEISDDLNDASFSICGKEYVLLLGAHAKIRDVLAFPAHSRTSPAFTAGNCQMNGKPLGDAVMAVLDNRAATRSTSHYSGDDPTLLPATAAWKIDEKSAKFVAISPRGVSCPRGGILTTDGGP
ncbi:MAG: hypothetical protein WAN65_03645 [Candidatus Sulfotelmatobacter sp.]